MKVVYVCGPFRAKNSWDREQNVRRAEEVALGAWRAGYAVICPHTNTRFFDGAADDAVWLDGDLEILRRCDFLLTTWGWENSKGACAEVNLARELGIPVVHHVDDLQREYPI